LLVPPGGIHHLSKFFMIVSRVFLFDTSTLAYYWSLRNFVCRPMHICVNWKLFYFVEPLNFYEMIDLIYVDVALQG
jgi:hypothetical protein